LQLFVRKDIHDHPLADFFDKLFENNPEAAQAGHNSKEWADLLRSVVPVNSEVDSRLNFMYVSKAFDLSRDIFERRFGLSRTVNSHTGKISWHLAPARLAT
jgi:hypothetical protein